MATVKYLKLGDKASSFYDPTTKLNVKKGQAVEVTLAHRQSKRINRALKTGHLDYLDTDTKANYKVHNADGTITKPKGKGGTKGKEEKKVDKAWKEKVDYTEKGLMSLTLKQLQELASDRLPDIDLTEAEIAEAVKATLKDAILEYEEEDDEEEDDEEEDDEEEEDEEDEEDDEEEDEDDQ